ncbi:TIGR04211 family SH3 domain-containing protein [Methylogaea oryzae]|uniref:SH3b domain-containing protein n=1 Tax=Methylogaea oryzae TaxID=1295382 RepID=A0A8D5AHU2_9GAMM|nr:TIGR04211 family SH3 domain-containing protein [Methylogaea oryzae]BBL71803.1 hypothetical protein MoryE10_24090 [Methylogaea oryzae]
MRKLILAACLLIPFASATADETAYVSDKLEAQLRSGPSLQNKIVRVLHSGVKLTVLEEDKEAGYTHVVSESGADGWILTRHITSQPLARAQLQDTTQKLDSLTQENKQLHAELDSLKKQIGDTNNAKEEAIAQMQRLNNETAQIRQASAGSVALLEERNQLLEKTAALENELENLRREKETLAEKDSQDWFMKGAGVLLGGILLGFILPKLSGGRRRGWDSF